jgi:hypothetical protein
MTEIQLKVNQNQNTSSKTEGSNVVVALDNHTDLEGVI